MFVIRETFTAKPGMASKLAHLFAEVMTREFSPRTRVLTDFVGPFNTVVLETEVDDLEEHGRRMREYMEKPGMRERMNGYTDMYVAGRREIYQLVSVPAPARR